MRRVDAARRDERSADRMAEIAEILGLGLIRLRARKSSEYSPTGGESSLDCLAHQSGHATPEKGRVAK